MKGRRLTAIVARDEGRAKKALSQRIEQFGATKGRGGALHAGVLLRHVALSGPAPAAHEQAACVALKHEATGQRQQHAVQQHAQQAQQDAALSGLLRKVRHAHSLRQPG